MHFSTVGKLSTWFWSLAAGIHSHWATKVSWMIRSGVPVRPRAVGWGLWSGFCAGRSSSSTPNWENHFFMELALCSGGIFVSKQERALPTLLTQTGLGFLVPLQGILKLTKHEKQPQVHQSLQRHFVTYVNIKVILGEKQCWNKMMETN